MPVHRPGDEATVRVLLLSDTHIGFDLPARPRVSRRRRGHDFLVNMELALSPALRGEVDLVVHGGDLLNRSRPHVAIVEAALRPLVRVAAAGVPVVLAPGNHERSRLPQVLLSAHPGLFVLDAPVTHRFRVREAIVAVAGFPYTTRIGRRFGNLVERTGANDGPADVRLLCMHQTVEGATVGIQDFTFRVGADVIPGRCVPSGFAAVLSGHIHRQQVLLRDLAGRPLRAPVVYPGAVERTSFTERSERKGYLVLELSPGVDGGRLHRVRSVELPARPMVILDVQAGSCGSGDALQGLRRRIERLDPHAVVRVRVIVAPGEPVPSGLETRRLRSVVPETMNLEVVPVTTVR